MTIYKPVLVFIGWVIGILIAIAIMLAAELDRKTYVAPSRSSNQCYTITDKRNGHKWLVVNVEGTELDISK